MSQRFRLVFVGQFFVEKLCFCQIISSFIHMNEIQLIKAIADEVDGSFEDARKYLNAFSKVVETKLREGRKISIKGLGIL